MRTASRGQSKPAPPPCRRDPDHTVIGMGMARADYDYSKPPLWWCRDCLAYVDE